MGLLIDGMWRDKWYDTKGDGKFKRQDAAFRSWITADGAPGPDGEGGFKAEAGRYHLYVSLACPWAHRTLIVRELKGLQDIIPVSIVHWFMRENGWEFVPEDGATTDPVLGARYMHQIYTAAKPDYTGRVTIPVIWDKKTETIVTNESSEIIRMFNSAFDGVGADANVNISPEHLRSEIDAVNEPIYHAINNGVYKAGFATKQDAYEEAFDALFLQLDKVEDRLSRQRWLVGERMTEADIRLFTTLIRFDAVYFGHFKCNRQRIEDYPNLSNYVRDIYQMPEVRRTVDFLHIKNHYYHSHETVNPTRIIPKGPELDFDAPHDRNRFEAREAA